MTETLAVTHLQVGQIDYPLARGTLHRSISANGVTRWEVSATARSACHIGRDVLHQLVIDVGRQRFMGTAWLDQVQMANTAMHHHFAGTGPLAAAG